MRAVFFFQVSVGFPLRKNKQKKKKKTQNQWTVKPGLEGNPWPVFGFFPRSGQYCYGNLGKETSQKSKQFLRAKTLWRPCERKNNDKKKKPVIHDYLRNRCLFSYSSGGRGGGSEDKLKKRRRVSNFFRISRACMYRFLKSSLKKEAPRMVMWTGWSFQSSPSVLLIRSGPSVSLLGIVFDLKLRNDLRFWYTCFKMGMFLFDKNLDPTWVSCV